MSSGGQPIVIDSGTAVVKAGFAGSNRPECVFPNYVGAPKHTRVMCGELDGDSFVGQKAQEHRGVLALRYPMECAAVTDWADMERVWSHVYGPYQLNADPAEHSVLMTEPALATPSSRRRAAEIFFETFNAPGIHFAMQGLLGLYATGRTTGVVCDSGEGATQAIAACEGYVIPACTNRIDIAGKEVTKYLKTLLRAELSTSYNILSDYEAIKDIKEKICFVRSAETDKIKPKIKSPSFTLPDGISVQIKGARYEAPELLFRPDIIGDESPGVQEILTDSIRNADVDLRRILCQNIVVSGGTSLMPGYNARLFDEVKKILPKNVQIKIAAPKERSVAVWIGGSVLALLDTFNRTLITKADYYEHGPSILRPS
ncbi:alpha-centractin [Nesidiocoris tenuis]|uniref:Alpha-centractin n=1 Tax=Nesidiocoris tenuis TaxID=355587 RepID=A0ABN7AML8_9HEMI|nr:alpha-centractin [Nesidiocoris tenuis]